MPTLSVFAPAKVNLTLHVVGKRDDGYHLLDSLVAFAGVGDTLTLTEAEVPRFSVSGPFGSAVPQGGDNLVLRAAALVGHARPADIVLKKMLPPSSGIGGGSADAAAAVRGMLALAMDTGWADPASWSDAALRPMAEALLALGADVPMCLISRPLRARGIGERIDLLPDLPRLPAVLVNPLRAMPTPRVFAALETPENPPMSATLPDFSSLEPFVAWLSVQRNDLEAPARTILPEIGTVTDALSACEGAMLARMSGSGATCFGIFPDKDTAWAAAERLAADNPGWWVKSAIIGGQGTRALPVAA
ncbi:MAG: 4-(cytidine 5'-diphospho)-2-C-methyl-D-erythritol kinase [Paracoccaceae bacterium]|nr:4-(cytidine 5'-diphospho)-2-C-methyl-D-erythritol kinase [Paracoccaceae bacterium]